MSLPAFGHKAQAILDLEEAAAMWRAEWEAHYGRTLEEEVGRAKPKPKPAPYVAPAVDPIPVPIVRRDCPNTRHQLSHGERVEVGCLLKERHLGRCEFPAREP